MEEYEVQSNPVEVLAKDYADAAFGKTLASVILVGFPIGSIVAIILAAVGLKAVNKAEEIAANHGVSAGGKKIAAKIMGKIGLIAGIVMTAFWPFYIILVVIMALA